jgi:NAD(P)-dependent dehydrogenase (short-subunit alcohol dehydrogenase family)
LTGLRAANILPGAANVSSQAVEKGDVTEFSPAANVPIAWTAGAGLPGKVVVVTGGARGIGRAVATAFASYGARVCIVDLDPDAAAAAAAALPNRDQHMSLGQDLRDISAHDAMFDRVRSQLGRLDVLAHLAAVLRRVNDIDDITEDDWDFQVGTNLKATFFVDRAAAKAMRAQGRGGRIINFTSQGWWTGGFGGSVVYNAAKGGVATMTRGLARTYAKLGITVNAVAPGFVDTPMMRSGMTDEQLEALGEQVPIGRMAEPDEVAGAVIFLASDQAAYITGATINVSGGFLMY